jgi:hypothetical protein
VEDRVADIQPVRNGGDKPIPFDASSHDGGCCTKDALRSAAIAFHHCATKAVHR